MRYLNFCFAVLLVAGCATNPKPETLRSIFNNGTPLDISGIADEKRMQLVLPGYKTATLVLWGSPVTSVGIQYPDEQSTNEEITHELFGSVGNGSIQEIRISIDKRFVFVKGNAEAYVSGTMQRRHVTVVNAYDLKHRKCLYSLDIER